MKPLNERLAELRMNTSNLESPDVQAWLDTKFFRSYRDVVEMSLQENATQHAAVTMAQPNEMIEFTVRIRLEVPGFIAKHVLGQVLLDDAEKAAARAGAFLKAKQIATRAVGLLKPKKAKPKARK
jgi:hypothetical protein